MTQNLNLINSANSSLAESLLQNLLKNPEAAAKVQQILQKVTPTQTDAIKNLSSDAKKSLLENVKKVDLLVSLGRLTQSQGTNLKGQFLKSAFGQATTAAQSSLKSAEKQVQEAFLDFEKENPNFFSTASRQMVKNYLQEGLSGISPDELNKIVDIIEKLETEAVTKFQQSKTQEKTALDENQQAKSRLETAAILAPRGSGDATRVFSRKEIAAMPTAEFVKNEAAIQDQIKKGLITS